MVAEKPSIAEAMANALSPKGNKPRPRRGIGRASPVFEFAATYPETGQTSCIRITSVVGAYIWAAVQGWCYGTEQRARCSDYYCVALHGIMFCVTTVDLPIC